MPGKKIFAAVSSVLTGGATVLPSEVGRRPVTVVLWETVAVLSFTVIWVVLPRLMVRRTGRRVTRPVPVASTVTAPGTRLEMTNEPAESVVVVRLEDRSVLLTVTIAPATGRFWGSVTEPRMEAVLV